MRNVLASLVFSASIALALPAFADDYVMMKVNGTEVTSSEVQTLWEGLFPPGGAPALSEVKPDMRDKILRGVMTEKLLMGEAMKQGVDTSEDVKKALEEIRKKLVVKAFLEQKTKALITEEALRKAYDRLVASLRGQKEVRARHILVADEKTAKEVKAKLDDGKKFEDVARDYSKDPGSAKQGGDLGYFTKDKMVKEFADAAFALKKGEVSDPVKSGFGYHIIEVEDIRPVQAPTFHQSKDQLRTQLQDEKLSEYIKTLVKNASVTVFDAKGKEVAFSKDIPQGKEAK